MANQSDQVLYQQSQGPEGQQFGKPAIDPIEIEHQENTSWDKSEKTQREVRQEHNHSGDNPQRGQKMHSNEHQGSSGESEVLYQQSQGPEGQRFGKPAIDPTQIQRKEGDGDSASRDLHTGSKKVSMSHGGLEVKEQKSSSKKQTPENPPQHKKPPHGKHNKDHSHDQEKTPKDSKWAQSAVGSENQPDHGESQSPFHHHDNKPQKNPNLGSENQPAREHTFGGSGKPEGENKKSGEKSSGLGSENQPAREHTSDDSRKPMGENRKPKEKISGLGSENQPSQDTEAQALGGSPKKNVKPFERETHKFEDDSEKTQQDTKWAQSALGNENQFNEHPSAQKGGSHNNTSENEQASQRNTGKSVGQENPHIAEKLSRHPTNKDQNGHSFKDNRDNVGVDPLKVIGGGLAGVAATAAGAGVIGTVAGAAAGAAGASKLGDKIEEHQAKKGAAA